MPQLQTVSAVAAAKLVKEGALLVDVREPREYAANRIPGSLNLPLSRLEHGAFTPAPGQAVVFFCASGGRTTTYAARLAARAGDAPAYVMAGGIAGWARVGQPVESGPPAGEASRPSLLGRLFAR